MDQSFESEICKVTQSIWQSILNLDVQKTHRPFESADMGKTLSGSVRFSGEWQGSILLHCPAPLARKAAAVMFAQNEEDIKMEDLHDTLGELVNMAGGCLKPMLPDPCYLSLPTVETRETHFQEPEGELLAKVNFECESIPFRVTLIRDTAG